MLLDKALQVGHPRVLELLLKMIWPPMLEASYPWDGSIRAYQ